MLVDRLHHGLLLGRDPLRMRQLESLVQAVNGIDQDRTIDEVRWESGGFAGARLLVVQIVPRKGILRHVVPEQHSFAEILTADVRIEVLPLRLGRILWRPVGIERRVTHGAGHSNDVRRLHAACIFDVFVDGPFLCVEVLVLEELQPDHTAGESKKVRIPSQRSVLHPVNPEPVLVRFIGGHTVGVVDESNLFPSLDTRNGM